jgi:putative peptidoglycan lipid II flippase
VSDISPKPARVGVGSILIQFLLRALGMGMSLVIAVGVAFFFGAGAASDAFFLMRRLMGNAVLVADAITQTTLVPQIVSAVSRLGAREALRRLRPTEIGFAASGAMLAAGLLFFPDQITDAMAPGLSDEAFRLASDFLQYLGLALPAIAATSVSGAFLNATRRYSAPVLLRLLPRLLILLALAAVPLGFGITAVALASVLGQIVVWAVYFRVRKRVVQDMGEATVPLPPEVAEGAQDRKGTAHRSGAVAIATTFFVISTFAENYYASIAGLGAIAILTLAQRISSIGVTEMMRSMLVVYYTSFVEHAVAGDRAAAIAEIASGLRRALFFTAPLALFVAVLSGPIADVLLGYGAFDDTSVRLVAGLVTLFALSSLFQTPASVLEVALMAQPRVPLARHFAVAMAAALILRLALMAVLVPVIGLAGLGWAAIGATLPQTIAHGLRLRRELGPSLGRRLVAESATVLLAAGVAAALAFGSTFLWTGPGASDPHKLLQFARLLVAGVIFGIAYVGTGRMLGQPETADLLAMLRRRIGRLHK